MSDAENSNAERRIVGRPFQHGTSGNPGGKPKKLREIEAMLDAEHRTPENMRQVFARLRVLAMGEVIEVAHKDGTVIVQLKAIPDFMRLYLERVMGPVKDLEIDLATAPPEALSWLTEHLKQ